MDKINILRQNDNGYINLLEHGLDKNGVHFTEKISGNLVSVENNCLYMEDRILPLIDVKRAVETIVNENGIVIYCNPFAVESCKAKLPEEVFMECVKMFGKEETIRMYKEKIEEIKKHNPSLAESYVEKLNIR